MEKAVGRKKHRNIYIDNHPLEEALETYRKFLLLAPRTEMIRVTDALQRVTVEPVYALMSSPHYQGAAMDGIVVRASDTLGASERTPVVLKVGEQFEYVNTGNPIPNDKDSVIMIEDVDTLDEEHIRLIQTAIPWQHIRAVGEDIVKGEMILPSKHQICAIDMAAMVAAGITSVRVYKKPRVGILPTGSEIKSLSERQEKGLEKGQIVDSNSVLFSGMVVEAGGIPKMYAPVSDEPELLKSAILRGIEDNDLLIINAGSSAGSKDYTVDLIKELGEVVIHGVAIKPGKPTILGCIQEKMVVGIPGYPVSAYFSFSTFVRPFIQSLSGLGEEEVTINGVLSQRVVSSFKHAEFVRVTLGEVNHKMIVTPLNRGAGNMMSLVKADGVMTVPREVEGIEKGTVVPIRLLKPISKIKHRIVAIGSHDIIMDLIADHIPMSSAHVGSLGGIMAMRRGECHIAPIHLLDEKTGIYNDTFVEKYFEPGTMAIIKGVKRQQGFMVQKGNPKDIKGICDLIRDDVVFVNRQKGSGTRQLLDYLLQKDGIQTEKIIGYSREMNTHMAVAADVSTLGADVALGTYSAALAMELDFIPVGFEAYEFLVSRENMNDERVQQFIRLLRSKEIQQKILELGGYDVDGMSEIRWVGDKRD